jgi:hypothetical protein
MASSATTNDRRFVTTGPWSSHQYVVGQISSFGGSIEDPQQRPLEPSEGRLTDAEYYFHLYDSGRKERAAPAKTPAPIPNAPRILVIDERFATSSIPRLEPSSSQKT